MAIVFLFAGSCIAVHAFHECDSPWPDEAANMLKSRDGQMSCDPWLFMELLKSMTLLTPFHLKFWKCHLLGWFELWSIAVSLHGYYTSPPSFPWKFWGRKRGRRAPPTPPPPPLNPRFATGNELPFLEDHGISRRHSRCTRYISSNEKLQSSCSTTSIS
jgi:hypothetical protein